MGRNHSFFRFPAIAWALSGILFTCVCRAQSTSEPSGLDSFGDDRLLIELSSRGLDDLLTRALQEDHIPKDRQDSIRAVGQLQRLGSDSTLTTAERDQIIQSISSNIDSILQILPADPEMLISQGRVIADKRVDSSTGILEYWGDSPAEKARLLPIATAAMKIFDHAQKIATGQAAEVANHITTTDDKLADNWRKLSDLAGVAAYQKARMQYAVALAMDASDASRAELMNQALDAFGQWDSADSGIQPQVRLLEAKLLVLRGKKADTDRAAKLLDSLTSAGDVAPPPTATLAFEARCFNVIATVRAGDLGMAQTALDAAKADQQKNFPKASDQIVAIRLLEYRLLAAKADQAPAGAAKDAANTAAVSALDQLMTDYPGLRNVITRQLANRMSPDADLAKLDTPLLLSMVDQGRQQVLADTSRQSKDNSGVTRALAAAREIIHRYDDKKIPADQVVEPSLLAGFFDEYLGGKYEAVDDLLDHINRFPDNSAARNDVALERARVILADLRQSTPVEPDGSFAPRLRAALNRFLPIAINPPFNHKEFTLQYAAMLFADKKWADAIKYYRMVPDTEEPNRLLTARYGEMLAIKNVFEETPNLTSDLKLSYTDQIQALAKRVSQIALQIQKSSATDAQKKQAKSALAGMSLLAADITRREEHDPQRVLDLLNNFEDSVQGLPDARSLLNGALFLRVQAYMQLGRNNDATTTLVKFLSVSDPAEGAQTVRDLLDTLDNQLQTAQKAQDQARIKQLADNRAMLSGFLVKWAAQSTDPKIHGYTYTYTRFDADTKRLAATLETDPAQRKKDLQSVLALYKALQSPENVALYQSTTAEKTGNDPLVILGIGLTAYDLGDYTTARDNLGQLIQASRLGEDNDQFWEATYKLLNSIHQLAKTGDSASNDADVAKALKLEYLIYRDGTGGAKWHEQFESLRKEVIPDWTPGE